MHTLDTILENAVAGEAVPFVVAMTGNARRVTYSGAAGPAVADHPAGEDTLFRIFSMTKAVGSTAAMILIDRGQLDFETPVEDILPEFGALQVVNRFDGETPIMRAPIRKATIRHLSTHTSGLEYEFWSEEVPRYLAATEHPTILSGTRAALSYPLMFDPGARWGYGIGIDWLGQIVEAVDGRRIDRFCDEEIFEPLGMHETVFEVPERLAHRLADVAIRGPDGRFGPFDIAPPPEPEIYGMGHALYSTAPDYMRFLRMFLNRGELDGNRILSEAGVARMLENHIGNLSFRPMITVAPTLTADCDPFPETHRTHSFGFLRLEEDVPGMRSAGSQTWAGVCNTHYWFDPAKDLAAVLMTQSLPFMEPPFTRFYEEFERAVYAG